MFRTDAAIYTAVVVARSTGPNRLNCDFRVRLRLRENVRRRRTGIWWEQSWMLHHDNSPSHTSVLTQQFLAKYKTAVILHTPYFPDLTPCDFFLFQKRNWSWKDAGLIPLRRSRPNSQRVLNDRNGLPGSVPKMEETVRPVYTCGRELLRGWWRPIGLMASFMTFLQHQSGIFWIDPRIWLLLWCIMTPKE
jgi:hypothetical protein